MKISALFACSALVIGAALPGPAFAGDRKPTRVTVGAPSSADVTADTAVTVSGKVKGGNKGRKVRLQLDTPHGWMPIGTASRTVNDKGSYTLKVPTGWYYNSKLRVATPKTRSRKADTSPGFRMRVRPAYTPSGKAKAWKAYNDRARWNPCSTLTYKVNTTGGPDKAKKLVRQSVRRLHQASGLLFEYRGTTKAIPFRKGKGKKFSDADLTISWASRKQVPRLKNGTIGWGAVWWNSRLVNYRGAIALKRNAKLTSQQGPGGTWQNLILHELGHTVGLDHVRATDQVMNHQIPRSPGRFNKGDLAGLRNQGATQGCHKGVRSGRVATPGFASAS